MKFGKNDCSEIEIEPLSPICSFPDIGGTTPLALDVPVPTFVSPVPPNECACFDFVPVTTDTVVINDCETVTPPKCTVDIRQADPDDCCAGKYIVKPTVEIPCMPFSVSKDVTVGNRSGDETRGVDGSVMVTVEKGCCDLATTVDVKLPDCVKGYDASAIPEDQIIFCKRESDGHVSSNTHKLVTLVEDKDNCSLYPRIAPLELPCCTLADRTISGSVAVDKRGSKVNWELKREDCELSLSMTPSIVDCACFNFEEVEVPVVVTECNTGGSVKVKIKKEEDTECCDGRFVVTPSVSIPCIPFSIGDADVWVHDKDGGTNVDGAASVRVDQNCCTLTPVVDITMPKCVKSFKLPTDNQIKYFDHGKPSTYKKLVSIETDEDECTFYPVITPVEFPCPFENHEFKGSAKLSNAGGTITWSVKYNECKPTFDLSVLPIPIPSPSTPCINDTCLCVLTKYSDAEGTEHYSEEATTIGFKGEVDKNGCVKYVVDPNTTTETTESGCAVLNLGTITVDPIESNGDIFVQPEGGGGGGGGGESGNGYINGSTRSDDDMWYAGGLGDLVKDSPTYVMSRGYYMRGGVAIPSDCKIPHTKPGTNMVKPPTMETSKQWCSARKDEKTGKRTFIDGYAHGTLNISMPTGAQWTQRGIAYVHDTFVYNSSGVLSWVAEPDEASIVAPGLSVRREVEESGNIAQTDNTSGLCLGPGDETVSRASSGLMVNDGDGIRIHGVDKKTPGDYSVTDPNNGQLEIQYGAGFRVIKDKTKTAYSEKYSSEPSAENGAIEVNDGDGIRIHGLDKKTPGDYSSTDPKNGQLEIQYGAGFRVIKDKTKTSDTEKYSSEPSAENGAIELSYGPGLNAIATVNDDGTVTYADKPGKIKGAIVPNDGRGLRIHGVDKTTTTEKNELNKLEVYKCDKDFEFHTEGKTVGSLVLNDKIPAGGEIPIAYGGAGEALIHTARRNNGKEFIIPVMVPNIPFSAGAGCLEKRGDMWFGSEFVDAPTYEEIVETLISWFSSTCFMFLHVTESGLVLSIDGLDSSASIQRHATSSHS